MTATEILSKIKVLDPVEGICELEGKKYNFSMYATYEGELVKDPDICAVFDKLNKESTEKSLAEINKPIGKTAAGSLQSETESREAGNLFPFCRSLLPSMSS